MGGGEMIFIGGGYEKISGLWRGTHSLSKEQLCREHKN